MDPVISVCLITYNHARYIRAAIKSILSQQVNSPWKIIIADDFSTDGTREILLEYKDKFPDRVQLILQEKNVGPAQNFINLITAPASKYIAYLEGDDYWTNSSKLQNQLDFLEANPQIYGCFHDVIVVDDNNTVIKEDYYRPHQEIFNQKDSLIYGGAYCTGSLMFRSAVLRNLPEWFIKSPSDYAIDLLITEYGNIAHLNINMGAYRIHQGGTWQGTLWHKNMEKVIVRYKVCLTNPKFKKEYGSFFYQKISEVAKQIALHYRNEKKYLRTVKYTWFYIYYSRLKESLR